MPVIHIHECSPVSSHCSNMAYESGKIVQVVEERLAIFKLEVLDRAVDPLREGLAGIHTEVEQIKTLLFGYQVGAAVAQIPHMKNE